MSEFITHLCWHVSYHLGYRHHIDTLFRTNNVSHNLLWYLYIYHYYEVKYEVIYYAYSTTVFALSV